MPKSLPELQAPDSWSERPVRERAAALEAACRAAMEILEAAPDSAARLARVDPPPASTQTILARLVERSRERRSNGG